MELSGFRVRQASVFRGKFEGFGVYGIEGKFLRVGVWSLRAFWFEDLGAFAASGFRQAPRRIQQLFVNGSDTQPQNPEPRTLNPEP